MSNQQRHSKSRKRRRKKKNPFFARQIMPIAAFSIVAIVVAIVFYIDANRSSETSKQEKRETNVDSELEFDTPESVLKHGSTKDLLAFVTSKNTIDADQPFVLLKEQLIGQISVYRELEKRSEELNKQQQTQIKNRLLAVLLVSQRFLNNDEISGDDLRTETIETATRLSNDDDVEIAQAAAYTLCALKLGEAYGNKSNAAHLDSALEEVQNFLRRFPESPRAMLTLYSLILTSTTDPNDTETTDKIIEAIKPYYRNSKVNSIRMNGNALEGRILLFRHHIIDFEGKAKIHYKNDLDNLTDRLDNFLAEEFTMPPRTVEFLIAAGLGLELQKRYDKAKYVFEKSLERLGEAESYDILRQNILNSLTRLDVKDQVLDFPDHTKTEHCIVLFIGDDDRSLNTVKHVYDKRTISANRQIEVILVTDVDPINQVQKFLDALEWQDFKMVQDLKRESVYFQIYPAKWRPSTLVLDQTGRVIDINPSTDDLSLLTRSLRSSN